ncbi:MAG: YciI family protein [Proteobacteria bacterium]|nr:YciI family protein [Pseudomonadota bacterium]
MRYMLIIHVDEAGWPRLTPEQQRDGMAAYAAFTEALVQAGALVGSGRLQPSEGGRTVRVKDGRRQILDGPFAETKEVIGGYFLIEASDMNAAVDWAARCPAAGHGAVEVRALRPA